MKDFFKPEDFADAVEEWPDETKIFLPPVQLKIITKWANAKLNAEIARWPVVFGDCDPNFVHLGGFEGFDWQPRSATNRTHTARLAFIEELPKKECEHEARVKYLIPSNSESPYEKQSQEPGMLVCKHCNKRLKTKWELDE